MFVYIYICIYTYIYAGRIGTCVRREASIRWMELILPAFLRTEAVVLRDYGGECFVYTFPRSPQVNVDWQNKFRSPGTPAVNRIQH